MSASLIGLGADLQQALDKMDRKLRRARWAGYVGVELYGISRRLHRLSENAAQYGTTIAAERREKELLEQARIAVQELGFGIQAYRQPHSFGWPIVVVFPGTVSTGSGPEAIFEHGVAVPWKP